MAVMLLFRWELRSLVGQRFPAFFPLSVSDFNTFFPDLRKLSLDILLGKDLKLRGSHSLGTLIEWKLYYKGRIFFQFEFPLAGDVN